MKKFLLRVLHTVSLGLLWLFGCTTLGIYQGLAYPAEGRPVWYTVLFYLAMVGTGAWLALHLHHRWKNKI